MDREDVARVLPARYELGRRLGGGGFAAVFHAVDRQLGREVAVKAMAPRSGDVHGPAHAEAQILASLSHPHLVSLFDVVETGELTLLVMEFVPGRTLAGLALPAPLEQVCGIGLAVADALDYVHSRRLLHRDIKPANLMIADDGVVKVVDFGIAKMMDGATVRGATGTIEWMAPEQRNFRPLGPATDLYSLALVLRWLLVGGDPHRADLSGLTAPQSEIAGVLSRSLSKSITDRHPSAHAFALDLAMATATALGPEWVRRSGLRLRLDDSIHAASGWAPAEQARAGPPLETQGPADAGAHGHIGVRTRGDRAAADHLAAPGGASKNIRDVDDGRPAALGPNAPSKSGSKRPQSGRPGAVPASGSPTRSRGRRTWRGRLSRPARLITASFGVLVVLAAVLTAMYWPDKEPSDAGPTDMPSVIYYADSTHVLATVGALAQSVESPQATYIRLHVEGELDAAGLTRKQLETWGLRIRTTIDFNRQSAAVNAVNKVLADVYPTDALNNLRTGLVAVNPATGAIVAWYGGAQYGPNGFGDTYKLDSVSSTALPPGFTFNAVTLLAALKAGMNLMSTFNVANNEGGDAPATVSLQTATATSLGTVYESLGSSPEVGAERIAAMAESLGIIPAPAVTPRITLGEDVVYPIAMLAPYSTIASGGLHTSVHLVDEVISSTGQRIYKNTSTLTKVLDDSVVRDAAYALGRVFDDEQPDVGVAASQPLADGRPAAGMAGTGQGFRSAWFCGFTAGPDNLASCVDMFRGGAQLESLAQGPGIPLAEGVHGTDWPLQIWKTFMDAAFIGHPVLQFEPPAYGGSIETPTSGPT